MLPMLFVVFGLMIANSLLFSRLVGRPLNHLMTRIEEISAGHYREQDSTFRSPYLQEVSLAPKPFF